MRQYLTLEDEPHLILRSLSVDYGGGSDLGHHTHPWPQLLYARSGAVRAHIDKDIWIVPPRRALWIPANTSHQLHMLGVTELRTLYFSQGLSLKPDRTKVLDVCGLLHEAVLRVCTLRVLDKRVKTHRHLARVIKDEMRHADVCGFSLRMPQDHRARRLADIFMQNRTARKDLSALLQNTGLGHRTAERLFKNETGVSPGRWRRSYRLFIGFGALCNGATIDHAAEVSGYNNRSAFTCAFNQSFGFTPGHLRKRRSALH